MSWAEVKKINDNMDMPLNDFFCQFLAGGYRQYFYQTQNFTIPFSGTYTIRAYCGTYGSYGKIAGRFTQGEILTITMTGTTALTVTSNLQETSVFHINLGKNANVNGNSPAYVKALAIGGAATNEAGGDAYVRCNNGIAAGGGGYGGRTGNNSNVNGFAGGAAYSWGTNTFSLGGGGGGGSFYGIAGSGGAGGAAYINGVALSTYCSPVTLQSGKGYNGTAGTYSSNGCRCYGGPGGNGGCGGGMGTMSSSSYIPYKYGTANTMPVGGLGYFSDGGYLNGGSARGGNGAIIPSENTANCAPKINSAYASPKGYFVGGMACDGTVPNGGRAFPGGMGGFLGGQGANAGSTNASGGKGGYSPYGFGGQGGLSFTRYGNRAATGGAGGDGKIFGGNGGSVKVDFGGINATMRGGTGGNGYYPGFGGKGGNVTVEGNQGQALTANIFLTGITPLRGMTATTSIVILEYGNSVEDF